MITLTKNGRELYIGVDHPTPKPEAPVILEGQIFDLYEYTYLGPKYIGRFTARDTWDGMTQIGPLKLFTFFGTALEIHYRGYYQWVEFKENYTCYDCTNYEEFIESLKKTVFTDDPDFLETVLGDRINPDRNPLISRYNYISYVDGVLVAGSQIRKIDSTLIKTAIENGKMYYIELDDTKIPPKETSRTELFEIPFTIKNGKIKRVRVGNEVAMKIQYPDFTMTVKLDPHTGEVNRLTIKHDGGTDDIIPAIDGISPDILALIISELDEKGVEAYKIIKELGGLE